MATLSALHRRHILVQTGVGVVINGVISLGFALAASHGKAVMALWGPGGMALDFLPQTFMVIFATTLAVALVTRKRIAVGGIEPITVAEGGLVAKAPRGVFVRAILLGILGAAVLTPVLAGLFAGLGVLSLPVGVFIPTKVAYGALLALAIGPPIVRASLARSAANSPT